MRAEEAVDEAGRGGEATARPLCAQRPAGGAQRSPWRGALGQPVGLGLGTERWKGSTLERADQAWGVWPERIALEGRALSHEPG